MENLLCIITGLEGSGTTYLSYILNSHSQVFSGYETGILLTDPDKFHEIKPYNTWLSHGSFHWGLPNNFLEIIKNMEYDEIYNYIYINKGSKFENIDMTPQYYIRKSLYFFDKTPRYIYNFKKIYQNLNNNKLPFFLVFKKFNEIYTSYVFKRNNTKETFYFNILKIIDLLNWLKENKIKNVYVINFENILEKNFIKKIQNIIYTYNVKINKEDLNIKMYYSKVLNYDYPYKNWVPCSSKEQIYTIDFIKKTYNNFIDELSLK